MSLCTHLLPITYPHYLPLFTLLLIDLPDSLSLCDTYFSVVIVLLLLPSVHGLMHQLYNDLGTTGYTPATLF